MVSTGNHAFPNMSCDCCNPSRPTPSLATPSLARRSAIGLAMASAAISLTAGGAFAKTAKVPATPQEAMAALMAGNARFVDKHKKPAACSIDIAALKASTAMGQSPFAAVLSCADSRVPPELVFDQTIGDLFVTRVAGNIAGADIIASLEYGAAVLGTKTILVLGHASCGAVKATIDGKPVPGQISTLYRSIRPAVDQAGTNAEAVTKANAQIQAGLLRDASPVLGDMVKQGTLSIGAGYYDLASGKVTLLG